MISFRTFVENMERIDKMPKRKMKKYRKLFREYKERNGITIDEAASKALEKVN